MNWFRRQPAKLNKLPLENILEIAKARLIFKFSLQGNLTEIEAQPKTSLQ